MSRHCPFKKRKLHKCLKTQETSDRFKEYLRTRRVQEMTTKGTVSRDGYFFDGLNILISTSVMVSPALSKAFHYLIQFITFY